MEDVLSLRKSPEFYAAMFNFYKEKQMILLSQLSAVNIPERLQGFHEHLIKAVYAQINFYADYTVNKMEKSFIRRSAMKDHTQIEIVHSELISAWNEILRLYPDLDPKTGESIYHRLCALDLI